MTDLSDDDLLAYRQKGRVLVLLAALERAGLAPVEAPRLHAFAYLADVLSPVWGLGPHECIVFKAREGPHYVDLQVALDNCVISGLVDVSELGYANIGETGARITGRYALRFDSPHLIRILERLGAVPDAEPMEHADRDLNEYLVELACALAVVRGDEFDAAAFQDATYADERTGYSNVIALSREDDEHGRGYAGKPTEGLANQSVALADRLNRFLPAGATFSAAEKLHLYASYLDQKVGG